MKIPELKNKFSKTTDISSRGLSTVFQLIKCKAGRYPRPVFMFLHLTNKCNLRCSYCYANVEGRFDNASQLDLPTNDWIQLIDDSCAMGARRFILYGGEPLLREGLGEIIDRCILRGALVEVLTNGHIVPQRIGLLKKVHSVCISLDGDQRENDSIRGKGNFNAVIRAIEACKQAKISVRVHSTINRFNLHEPAFLPRLAEMMDITVSYSIPHVHSYVDQHAVGVTDADIRHFLQTLIACKRAGLPIDNTYNSLRYSLNWPFHMHYICESADKINAVGNAFCFERCVFGREAVVVDSEGYVIKCINRSMREGLRFQDVGFKSAYEHGLAFHHCYSCSYPQFIETIDAIRLAPRSLLKGLLHYSKMGN